MEMEEQKLSLFAAVMMIIGGQIGGGIFGALGPAMQISKQNVLLAFLYGGILSLITAYSYSIISTFFNDDGGSYFEDVYPNSFFNALPSWFLLFGYILTMSLYSNTFGSFLAEAIGGSLFIKNLAILGIMFVFMTINLKGVKLSATFENVLVLVKIIILLFFVIAGFVGILGKSIGNINNAIPHDSSIINLIASVVMSSSIIFVAYEGLELGAVNYSHTDKPKHNIPKALTIAPIITIIVYLLVAFVASVSLTPEQVATHQETALAIAAEPVLGSAGFIIITIGALISTSSAILATLFGTANLAKDLADQGHLPKLLGKLNTSNTPYISIISMTIITMILSVSMDLTGIASFASAGFLLVFAIVNFLGFEVQKNKRIKIIHLTGALLTVLSLGALVLYLSKEEVTSLYYIIGGFSLVFVLYSAYRSVNTKFLDKVKLLQK